MENGRPSKELTRSKDQFLSGMSREIERTMKEILQESDLLRKTGLSVQQNAMVDAIYGKSYKLSWIVNDILDFCHLELGKVNLQHIDFNLEYLIHDIFRKAVEHKGEYPIDTYIDIDKSVPKDLVGDPTRLRQVLANLLSNAFKFTIKGEVGIIVRQADPASPSADGAGRIGLRITVKDSGPGIPSSDREKIFEFHGRPHPMKTWEYGGTGLGLSMCKLIVESMGGAITYEQGKSGGSEFTVALSFDRGNSLIDQGVYPLRQRELVGKKVMIVDDNEIARKILKKCCETMGIEVLLLSASPHAVLQLLDELAASDQPHLILCDIMMPEMDGYELARKIRSLDKFNGIKMIAVTSAVRVGGARYAQECGFNGFLPKPVFLDELARVIATVLGDQRKDGAIVTRHMAQELILRGMKILVAAPANADREFIARCFDVFGCQGRFAASGEEALGQLREHPFDMCLLDAHICRDEHVELVRQLKEIGGKLPVVVLQTLDDGQRPVDFKTSGADDVLTKPLDMQSLKDFLVRYGKG